MSAAVAKADADIDASVDRVWSALTEPEQIQAYMMGSRVETDWQVGSPIVWKGEYDGKPYEDKGTVVAYDEPGHLCMTHFSPLGGQDDVPENYHTLDYTLTESGGVTHIELVQDNCKDDDEAQQFSSNWQQMLDGLKSHVEGP